MASDGICNCQAKVTREGSCYVDKSDACDEDARDGVE